LARTANPDAVPLARLDKRTLFVILTIGGGALKKGALHNARRNAALQRRVSLRHGLPHDQGAGDAGLRGQGIAV
jgi:hypothetical protein